MLMGGKYTKHKTKTRLVIVIQSDDERMMPDNDETEMRKYSDTMRKVHSEELRRRSKLRNLAMLKQDWEGFVCSIED